MSSKTTKFESLLEAVPDALAGVDHAGVIQFVNRQTELLLAVPTSGCGDLRPWRCV
jgi:nitrogen fixation/metabolism regulation signal transduction histidine kinase